jgi:hypothetical protein
MEETMKLSFKILLLCLSVSIGCTLRYTQIPKLNIAGPDYTDNTFKISNYKLTDINVESNDYYHIIIFFPIIGQNQDIDIGMIANAIDKVCRERNFSFMTNVRIYTSGWYIPLIYGRVTVHVKGEGWTAEHRKALLRGLQDEGFFAFSDNTKYPEEGNK